MQKILNALAEAGIPLQDAEIINLGQTYHTVGKRLNDPMGAFDIDPIALITEHLSGTIEGIVYSIPLTLIGGVVQDRSILDMDEATVKRHSDILAKINKIRASIV